MRKTVTALVKTLVKETLRQGADLAGVKTWYFDTVEEAETFLDKAAAQGWDDYGGEAPKRRGGGRCSLPNL